MLYYFFSLLICCLILSPYSLAVAQENKKIIEAWQVLGVTANQVKAMKDDNHAFDNAVDQETFMEIARNQVINDINSVSAPTKHTLIMQDPIFPFSEPTPVAMSPNKKTFYAVIDGKLAAYSIPSGQKLWEANSTYYVDKLLATNKGVFAECYDHSAHRLYGMGKGVSSIHFFSLENKLSANIEHMKIIPAMSQNGTFLALNGDTLDEIAVLNTETFEVNELPIDKNLYSDITDTEDYRIILRYYENLSYEEYKSVRDKFWAKYGIKPMGNNMLELEHMYIPYTRPKNTTLYPTLKIQTTAVSMQKEYAFAGDSPYIFILNTLTGHITPHKLEDTTNIKLLSFSADGKTLVALNSSGTLHIYKNEQWQQIEIGIHNSVNHMAVDTHGDAIWLAGDMTLYSISLKNSEALYYMHSSFINALAFSSKANKAVVLTEDEEIVAPDVFIPIANTDTKINSYHLEKMNTLHMCIPTLNKKQILSFDGEVLLLRNALNYTKIAEGTRMHFSYDISSATPKITIENNPEYFSLYNMYHISSFHEITPEIYARAELRVNENLLTVFNTHSEFGLEIFTLPKFLYPSVPGFTKVYFTQKGTFMSLGLDNRVMLWSITQDPIMPLLAYSFFTDGNYIVTNKDGNFFSPSEERFNSFHWVYNCAPLEAIDFKKLADTYRNKNIIQETLQR